MQNLALLTAGVVFLIVVVLHLLRLIFRWESRMGKFLVPLWLSVAGFIFAASLSLWILSLVRSTARSVATSVTFASDTYIFCSLQNKDFFGEGFFLKLASGEEFFIYSKPEDNPHDLANTKRKFYALIKTGNIFRYPLPKMIDAYLSSKYDLNAFLLKNYGMAAEHSQLPEQAYGILVEETRKRGMHKNIAMIYYKDLNLSANEIHFSCRDITGIDDMAMTTGGSVYLFTINIKEMEPLSIVVSAKEPGSQERLGGFLQKVKSSIGSDKNIVAKNVQFQHEIFTFSGVRTGWTAFIDSVSIK